MTQIQFEMSDKANENVTIFKIRNKIKRKQTAANRMLEEFKLGDKQ